MKRYDFGSSCPEALYNLALFLEAIQHIGIDWASEAGQLLTELCFSTWFSLPMVFEIDFREPAIDAESFNNDSEAESGR